MAHFFAEAVAAKRPAASWVLYVSIAYAAVLALMSLLQLFSLEEFVPIIQDYALPGGVGTATLFACGVITAQVFSLPYLLRMAVSPLFRLLSCVLSFVAPLLWFGVGIYALAADRVLENGGMLGEKLPVATDGVHIILALLLIVLAVASAYGLYAKSSDVKS